MADNYLEKRYQEVFGSAGGKKVSGRPALDVLLKENRSYRGYDKGYVVHRIQLEAIVAVNTRLASGVNAQNLRFRLVTKGPEADAVLAHVRMGRGLPELGLPLEGTEPEAFIVICSRVGENPTVDIDLGISVQSMLLKATEMKLGGLIIRSFDREEIRDALSLALEPVCVLAIGKPAEKVELVTVHEGDSLKYYRKDGVHYVPKLGLEDLIINE